MSRATLQQLFLPLDPVRILVRNPEKNSNLNSMYILVLIVPCMARPAGGGCKVTCIGATRILVQFSTMNEMYYFFLQMSVLQDYYVYYQMSILARN